jgi:hypothetical protein
MLLAGAVRGVPGIAIPVRLHWGSCQHADEVASQAARCVRSFRSRLAYWHCLPGHLDPLVGGVDVDEQFAGPAEVFTLPYREPGGCSDAPQDAQVAAECRGGCVYESSGQSGEGARAILDVHH